MNGLLVAHQLRYEVPVGQVPHQHPAVDAARSQEPTAHAEGQRVDGGLVACHEAHLVTRGAVPEADAAVTGARGHVVGVGMELDALEGRYRYEQFFETQFGAIRFSLILFNG